MSRADHARLPQRPAIGSPIVVGVEGVDRIVLCNNKHYVMRRLIRQGEIADIERLRINQAIHRVAKQLAESIGVDIRRSKNRLLGILSLMRIVISPRQHIRGLPAERARHA